MAYLAASIRPHLPGDERFCCTACSGWLYAIASALRSVHLGSSATVSRLACRGDSVSASSFARRSSKDAMWDKGQGLAADSMLVRGRVPVWPQAPPWDPRRMAGMPVECRSWRRMQVRRGRSMDDKSRVSQCDGMERGSQASAGSCAKVWVLAGTRENGS